MRNKKKVTFALLLLLIVLLYSGCGDVEKPVEKQATETEAVEKEKDLEEIMADLNSDSSEFLDTFDIGYRVTDLELIKRNTKDGSDEVYCTVSLANDNVTFMQDFKFTYNYYTTGGWILDGFESTGEPIGESAEITEAAEAPLLQEFIDLICTYSDPPDLEGEKLEEYFKEQFAIWQAGEGFTNIVTGSDGHLQNADDSAGNTVSVEGSYSRTNGPKCGLSIWSSDENGILFAMGIGASGYLAYVDMRDYIAEWTGSNTAVYKDSYNNYQLTFQINADGSITLRENSLYGTDFSLAGDYVTNSIAGKSCEFVFPNSDTALIYSSELEGKTAMECKIARNEIYARHGRLFQDEALQGYFNTCSWYAGTIAAENFSDSLLNEMEKANLQIISEYESKMGY